MRARKPRWGFRACLRGPLLAINFRETPLRGFFLPIHFSRVTISLPCLRPSRCLSSKLSRSFPTFGRSRVASYSNRTIWKKAPARCIRRHFSGHWGPSRLMWLTLSRSGVPPTEDTAKTPTVFFIITNFKSL